MRTSTLLSCLITWLVSVVSMVKCHDNYKCNHGAIISAEQITNTLTPPGIKTNNLGLLLINNERRPVYWREISVAPEYLAINGETLSYRAVFYDGGILLDILEIEHSEPEKQITKCIKFEGDKVASGGLPSDLGNI
ncbi:BgTH12-06694 [Blumeria graminis f. sp. triticale]|uniref:BgTH12-06694 n=1 Tax=Blumeria graminis f. sp. triticale TaxID=1689686 RepID=A0A9W4GDY0_BLUGR|nr:BgTH12-06694 [Blumeria graminis f. sp. triticale]